jgi:hypothetical protein
MTKDVYCILQNYTPTLQEKQLILEAGNTITKYSLLGCGLGAATGYFVGF